MQTVLVNSASRGLDGEQSFLNFLKIAFRFPLSMLCEATGIFDFGKSGWGGAFCLPGSSSGSSQPQRRYLGRRG